MHRPIKIDCNTKRLGYYFAFTVSELYNYCDIGMVLYTIKTLTVH